jgi:transposase-like protein
MNVHKNARLTPRGRERIVELVANEQTPKTVSEAVGVCLRTVRKWVDRYRRAGLAGLQDRSSRPDLIEHVTASLSTPRRQAGVRVPYPGLLRLQRLQLHPDRTGWTTC